MNLSSKLDSQSVLEELRDHIHGKTFGRLHDLAIDRIHDGRIRITATAHSRFVHQLAEWAVLECVPASDILLSISVSTPVRQFTGVPK